MYDADPDPYCYPGTSVLRNIPDLYDQAALDAFEAISTAARAGELSRRAAYYIQWWNRHGA